MTGTRIRTVRKGLGSGKMSQTKFAALLGYVRMQTISELENEKTNLSGPALVLVQMYEQLDRISKSGESKTQLFDQFFDSLHIQ